MNRQIRGLGLAISILFIALFVQLNYLQVIHTKKLAANPLNHATIVNSYTLPRGDIISADGVTLATSVATNDQLKYLRKYPTGSLFEGVTGYYSYIYGSDGAEAYYNNVLTGKSSPFKFPTSINGFKKFLTKSNNTQSITLTLLDKLQKIAQSGLAGRDGSVVALDPKTGAVLAMYSNPTFDPNGLASHNPTTVQASYKAITALTGGPLATASYRQIFFPGSSFKIVTASAVYDHKPALASKTMPTLTNLSLPDTTTKLHNFAGESCGGQILALFTVSCDTGFAQIGLDLGATNLSAEARSFGFDQVPPIDLPFPAKSNFPAASSFAANLPTLAYSAIGQENVEASPLEMALVGSAIADGGQIMKPHILQSVTNSQNQVVATYKPAKWLQATSSATAAQVTKLMISVVSSANGTGGVARIPGIQVAAKTGTAQTGTHHTDDWFVAFAPANDPRIVVSVVLPNQGNLVSDQGGTLAAPIAKSIIESYLSTSSSGQSPSTTSGSANPSAPTTGPTSPTVG